MIKFKEGNLRIPKWNRRVFVVAGGTTAYRKRFPEYKLEELVMMAFKNMLEDNNLKMDPLEAKGLINFAAYGEFADHFQDQLLCEAKVHDYLGLDPLHNLGIKTGGATGGSTILAAGLAVASGYANVALAGSAWMKWIPVRVISISPQQPVRILKLAWAGSIPPIMPPWQIVLLKRFMCPKSPEQK